MLALLLACTRPDPDLLLRAHNLDGASAAWAELHGTPLDTNHIVADILSRRAASDPTITAATLAETMEAIRLLEGGKPVGAAPLDLSIHSMEGWLGGLEAIASGPFLVAVGRSETALDRDVFQGGDLPWRSGRLAGFARRDLAALGRQVDALAAPRLVTVRLRDATGDLAVTFTPRGRVWWSTAASDPAAGARLVLAGELAFEQGKDAALARYGAGWVGR